MILVWAILGAAALWAITRLGRQAERPGRGQWRAAVTVLAAAALAGGGVAAVRGAWIPALFLLVAGVWLVVAARRRPAAPARPSESMSLQEARATLGVGPEADEAEIRAAWRRLMARAHPDTGGSEGLAARLNAARDRLLRR